MEDPGRACDPRQPNPHYAASVHAHAAGRPRTTSPAVPLPYGRMDAGVASRQEARPDSQTRTPSEWGRRGEHTSDARAKDGWGRVGKGIDGRKGPQEGGGDQRDGGSRDPRDGGGRGPRDGGGRDPRDGGGRDPRDGSSRDPPDGSSRDPRDGGRGPRDVSGKDARVVATRDPRDKARASQDATGREDRVAGSEANVDREASVRGSYDRTHLLDVHDMYGGRVRGSRTGRRHVVPAGDSRGEGPWDGRRLTAGGGDVEHAAAKRPRTDGYGVVHAGDRGGRGRGGRDGSGGGEDAQGRVTGQRLQDREAKPTDEREAGGGSEGVRVGGQSVGQEPEGFAQPEGPRRLPKAPISLVQVRKGKSLKG